jgi:hypothetical protein
MTKDFDIRILVNRKGHAQDCRKYFIEFTDEQSWDDFWGILDKAGYLWTGSRTKIIDLGGLKRFNQYYNCITLNPLCKTVSKN